MYLVATFARLGQIFILQFGYQLACISRHPPQVAYSTGIQLRFTDSPIIFYQRLEKNLVGIALNKKHHMKLSVIVLLYHCVTSE